MIEKVEVGDWSSDGHNMSETFLIEVPPDIDTDTVYEIACKELGFKMDDYCDEYEDNVFPKEHVQKILHVANEYNIPVVFASWSELIDIDGSIRIPEDGEYVYISPDDFFALWLAMVNIGIVIMRGPTNGFLAKQIVQSPTSAKHYIGGYGLFS